MMNNNNIKVAFIGWNPFQLIHVSALIKQIPNSIFILENKHNSVSQFNDDLLIRSDVPVKIYSSKDIHKLDDLFDIIICQTIFTDIHKFEHAKIAMIQYGYAKEAHNYGTWRSLADVCFTYGSYASNKISYFCPTIEVGYLRKFEIEDSNFSVKAKLKYKRLLNPGKKTVLYLPTWGEENSSKEYLDAILSLKEHYNIIIKPHHNTDLLSANKSTFLNNKPLPFLGPNDDSLQLIAIADVIISDYSGAIFDALFCKKPIILANPKASFKGSHKVDEYSIEYLHRDELGYIINDPKQLNNAIQKCLSDNKSSISNELYLHLYSDNTEKAHKKINKELITLATVKKTRLSQQQLYVRQEAKKMCAIKYSGFRYKIINLISHFYSKALKIFKN